MKPSFFNEFTEIAATLITNKATVTANNAPSVSAEVTFLVEDSADLMVEKSADRTTGYTGQKLTYSIRITNNGPSDATDVVLTDTLSSKVNFEYAVLPQGTYSYSNNLITCNLGAIAKGESKLITVTVILKVPGLIENYVYVTGSKYDPNLANNSASIITTVVERSRGFDLF